MRCYHKVSFHISTSLLVAGKLAPIPNILTYVLKSLYADLCLFYPVLILNFRLSFQSPLEWLCGLCLMPSYRILLLIHFGLPSDFWTKLTGRKEGRQGGREEARGKKKKGNLVYSDLTQTSRLSSEKYSLVLQNSSLPKMPVP